MIRSFRLLAIAALALSACSTAPALAQGGKVPFHRPVAAAPAPVAPGQITEATAQKDPISVVKQFTVDDLQAALDDANAQSPPDTVSAACYSALIPLVRSGAANPLPKGLGAFQALQKARDLKAMLANLQSPTGPLQGINVACAPLILDTQNTLIKLGVLGGVVAVNPLHLPIPLPGF